MATLPQIWQQWNNFTFNNQQFNSKSAAAKAQTRWINTTWWKPDVWEIIKKAAANNVSSSTIAKAAWTAVAKAGNLPQNQTAQAQETVKSLQNISKIWENIQDPNNPNPENPTDNWTEWASWVVTELDPNTTGENAPAAIDPATWLPAQWSADAWQWWAAWQSNAAGGWWSSAIPSQSNAWWSAWWGGWVNGWSSTVWWVWAGNAMMMWSDSSIWDTMPNANAPIADQSAMNAQWATIDQWNINNIKQDQNLWLSNSPDSPFWNKFWNPAIDQETWIPWYMNERNKVIASQLMLSNPNMKSMSDAARKQSIIEDIVRRQGKELDPAIMDWYQNTANTINNLITRQIPPYTSNDFFGMMLKGESVSEEMTENNQNPSYMNAKSRFNNLKTFSSMNVNDLANQIKSGRLNQWSVGWNDLINKGMWQILNDANAINNTTTGNSIVNKVLSEAFGFSSDISLALQESGVVDFLGTGLEWALSLKIFQTMTEDKLPTVWAYLAADDDVQAAKTASRESEAELNKLWDEINAFSDDIKTKVVERWWEATGDPFLESYIVEKTKPFVRKREALNGQYKNQIAKLEDATENAKLAFEIKEYNKNMEIKWYEFILNSINSNKQAKASAEKAQYDMAKDERDFAYKVANDQRWYELDLAKFRKAWSSRWTPGSSANDIIQWIYNWSIKSTNVFNKKTLASLWLSDMSREWVVWTLTNALFSENLSKKSSIWEMSTAVNAIKTAFGDDYKESKDYLAYLNNTVWWPRALNYVRANFDDVFWDWATPTEYASAISLAAWETDISKSQLITDTLIDKLWRSWANSVLDQLWLKKSKTKVRQKYEKVISVLNPFD